METGKVEYKNVFVYRSPKNIRDKRSYTCATVFKYSFSSSEDHYIVSNHARFVDAYNSGVESLPTVFSLECVFVNRIHITQFIEQSGSGYDNKETGKIISDLLRSWIEYVETEKREDILVRIAVKVK